LRSFVYLVLVRLVGVLTGRGNVSQLQLENAVLRHQVMVLRRTVRRPELKEVDRAFLAAASRALSRERWASFMVTPQTLLRWHRELVRRKWTYPRRGPGRPPLDPETADLIGFERPSSTAASMPSRWARMVLDSFYETTGSATGRPRPATGPGTGGPPVGYRNTIAA